MWASSREGFRILICFSVVHLVINRPILLWVIANFSLDYSILIYNISAETMIASDKLQLLKQQDFYNN